jgi:hypothetical protein
MAGFINRRGRGQRRGGYLLLEVVLALGVSSMVVVSVFSLASGALSLSEAIADEGRDQIERESFLGFMERNLEMLPGNAVMDLKAEDSGSHYTSAMTFQNVPTSFGWSGQVISAEAVQLATVLRRDGDLDVVLRYYEEPILDDSDSTADVLADPVAEITLLRDVWRFEWRVLDGRTMDWDYEWDIRGRMPLQLELNVVFHRNGDEVVHYFWIPPKANPETIMRGNLRPARGATQGRGGDQRDGENRDATEQPRRGGGGTSTDRRPGGDRGTPTIRPPSGGGRGNPTRGGGGAR